MWPVTDLALFAIGVGIYSYWFYQVIIGFNGLRGAPSLPRALELPRFVVLVPAHNEELVIGHLLESLNTQSFPRDRFDVVVVCDNCTDRTAEVAAQRAARVLLRDEPERGGKTKSLRWALEHIDLNGYEALVVFDADNLVDRDFLARMNDYLEAHPDADAVQGYLDTKNPDDSWVTRVYALTFWYANRFWQLARANVGLSVNLGGTGEVLRTSALRRWGWDWSSLTDDLELTCRIVLEGGRVHWNDAAVAFDEKPVSLDASRAQRARWLQGHYWALRSYGPSLLASFLRSGRLRYLDLLLHLLMPGRAATSYLAMFGGIAILAVHFATNRTSTTLSASAWAWWIFPACGVLQCVVMLIVAPSLYRRRLTLRYVPDAFSFLWYGLRWLPTMVASIARAHRQEDWTPTPHTKALAIEDMSRGGRP